MYRSDKLNSYSFFERNCTVLIYVDVLLFLNEKMRWVQIIIDAGYSLKNSLVKRVSMKSELNRDTHLYVYWCSHFLPYKCVKV